MPLFFFATQCVIYTMTWFAYTLCLRSLITAFIEGLLRQLNLNTGQKTTQIIAVFLGYSVIHDKDLFL